jgi:hypothetical protein
MQRTRDCWNMVEPLMRRAWLCATPIRSSSSSGAAGHGGECAGAGPVDGGMLLLDRLLEGTVRTVLVEGGSGRMTAQFNLDGCGVLPGSFDPLHEGHRKMADAVRACVRE